MHFFYCGHTQCGNDVCAHYTRSLHIAVQVAQHCNLGHKLNILTSTAFLVMEKRLSEVEVTLDCNISALQEFSELFTFRGWCSVRTAYSVRP